MPIQDNYEIEIEERISKIKDISLRLRRVPEHMMYEKGFEDGMRYFRDIIHKQAIQNKEEL